MELLGNRQIFVIFGLFKPKMTLLWISNEKTENLSIHVILKKCNFGLNKPKMTKNFVFSKSMLLEL